MDINFIDNNKVEIKDMDFDSDKEEYVIINSSPVVITGRNLSVVKSENDVVDEIVRK